MKYFTEEELRCKCGCKVYSVGEGFPEHLDELRESWGKPLNPTNCCRCKAHNKAVGGKDGSFHQMDAEDLTGVDGCIAIDINTFGWTANDKWRFAQLAMSKGWSIGVSPKGFIHIDRRADYVGTKYYKQPALFNY